MKTKGLQWISFFLVLVMTLASCPVFAMGESAFVSHTQGITPVYHLALSTATVTDGNYNNYYYVGQQFVPAESVLSGISVPLNLTHGQATVHLEIRESPNGQAIASSDTQLTSQGDKMAWYELLLSKPLQVTVGQVYYFAYWLTARDSGSVCIVYATTDAAGANPAYQSQMSAGGNATNLAVNKNLIQGFSLLTNVAIGSFDSYRDGTQPLYHLGLSSASNADPHWNDYRYVAQEFVPTVADCYGIAVALNLTGGNAVVHLEIRSTVNGKALATASPLINSKGNGMAWYDLPLNEKITLTPGETYYAVCFLESRDADADCIVYGNDLGANGAPYPLYLWQMNSGLPTNFSSESKNLVMNFSVLTEAVHQPQPPENPDDPDNPNDPENPDDPDDPDDPGNLEPSEKVLYGDVDEDTKIGATDALWVLQSVVGKRQLTEKQQTAAEVSADQKITAEDALWILKYVVGKVEQFPVQQNGQPENPDDPQDPEPPTDPTDPNDPDKPNDPDEGVVNDPERAPITQGYGLVEGLKNVTAYATPVAPIATDQAFNTLTQINMDYSTLYDLDIDCVLAYVYGFNHGASPENWVKNKTTYGNNTKIGLMIAINRDNGEYLQSYAGNRGYMDVQTNARGDYKKHSAFGNTPVYYMVPSMAYIEYKWQVLESYLSTGQVSVVALEEPEYWNDAGYSEAYKQEYKDYYGTNWTTPNSSAAEAWKHQKLKAYLFMRANQVLSERIKAKYPHITVLTTTHSTLSYGQHGISTGTNMYTNLDTIDGVIGQTWSDDASLKYTYGGNKVDNVFMNALYAYNSYGEFLTDGKTLYLLQDPASDSVTDQETLEQRWKQTVIAAMMQNDTTSFQSTIWPQRAFQAAGMNYKTQQLNINKMYQEFSTLSGANYCATPGIALATSDTAGWHINYSLSSGGDSNDTYSGIYYSLQNDGNLVDSVCLDTLTSVSQLKDVNLLILTYDAVKPLSAQANQVIAQWVKEGGRLLFLSGVDPFSTDVTTEWWSKQGTTPMNHLLSNLGINGLNINAGVSATVPIWNGSGFDASGLLNSAYAARTFYFSGGGISPFISVGNQTIGFESTCGKGKAVVVGIPSSYYANSASATAVLRQLCAKAMAGSDVEYKSGSSFVSVRGNYFAYYNAGQTERIADDKTYINLFSANLELVSGGDPIPRLEAVLYYDVTAKVNSNIPRIGFTGGWEAAPRYETNECSRYTISYPSASVAATILFGNGRYPQKVTAVNSDGKAVSLITSWDEYTETLLVKANNPDVSKPITFTVEWGDEYNGLDTNYEYQGFTHSTTSTNGFAADPLLYEYTCMADAACYYCDDNTFVTWKMDLNTYKDASFTIDVLANYVVEVSFDNQNWILIEDYSKIGPPVGHLADGTFVPADRSRNSLTINATDYQQAASAQAMYVRLSSCYMNSPDHPNTGHGGTTYGYNITYLAPILG